MLKTYLSVMMGGAAGTAARMWLSSYMAARWGETFPVGTLAVNVVGCFIIGFFAGLTGPEGPFLVSPLTRQTVMVGFLGGFTTFSSFSLQTLTLAGDGEWTRAWLNVILSVALCLLAAWGGQVLASAINRR